MKPKLLFIKRQMPCELAESSLCGRDIKECNAKAAVTGGETESYMCVVN